MGQEEGDAVKKGAAPAWNWNYQLRYPLGFRLRDDLGPLPSVLGSRGGLL